MIPDLVGAANEITMVIHDVRDIAQTNIGRATATAHGSKQAFDGTPVAVSAFSDVPLGRELGVQHKAAHEVFAQTIAGVLADLEEFRAKLLACADSHETNDDMVRSALLSLGRSYRHHDYHATQNYNRGRRHQGNALDSSHAKDGTAPTTGVHGAVHASDSAASSGTTNAAPAQPASSQPAQPPSSPAAQPPSDVSLPGS